MTSRRYMCVLVTVALAAVHPSGAAQGHGPIYGLSTPTLGKGGWSVDATAMGRVVGGTEMAMLRPMVSYGITEDIQMAVSLPMPLYVPQGLPQARAKTRMPATPD